MPRVDSSSSDLRFRIYDLRIMDMDDFEVGEECLVRVRVSDTDGASVGFDTIAQHGEVLMEESFRLLETELDAVVKEEKPKHSPYRRFREGDKVRVVDRDGRSWWLLDPHTTITNDGIYTVLENESEVIAGGYGELRIAGIGTEHEVPFYFLELVTPVEEVMPYKVVHTRGFYSVEDKKLDIVASYSCKLHPNAKEAAEAECARLNEDWRKEREND